MNKRVLRQDWDARQDVTACWNSLSKVAKPQNGPIPQGIAEWWTHQDFLGLLFAVIEKDMAYVVLCDEDLDINKRIEKAVAHLKQAIRWVPFQHKKNTWHEVFVRDCRTLMFALSPSQTTLKELPISDSTKLALSLDNLYMVLMELDRANTELEPAKKWNAKRAVLLIGETLFEALLGGILAEHSPPTERVVSFGRLRNLFLSKPEGLEPWMEFVRNCLRILRRRAQELTEQDPASSDAIMAYLVGQLTEMKVATAEDLDLMLSFCGSLLELRLRDRVPKTTEACRAFLSQKAFSENHKVKELLGVLSNAD
jgi:hypothetical protein